MAKVQENVIGASKNEFKIAGTVVNKFVMKNFTIVTVLTKEAKTNFPHIYCYGARKELVDSLPDRANITVKGRVSTYRERNENATPRQVLTAETIELSKPKIVDAFGDNNDGKAFLYPNKNELYLSGEIVYVSGTESVKKYLLKISGVRNNAYVQVTQYVRDNMQQFKVGDFVNALCNVQTVKKERDGNFVYFANFVVLEAHLVKK